MQCIWATLCVSYSVCCVRVCVCPKKIGIAVALILPVVFVVGLPVVGGLRARDGEVFVGVDILNGTQKRIITHSSRRGNEYPAFINLIIWLHHNCLQQWKGAGLNSRLLGTRLVILMVWYSLSWRTPTRKGTAEIAPSACLKGKRTMQLADHRLIKYCSSRGQTRQKLKTPAAIYFGSRFYFRSKRHIAVRRNGSFWSNKLLSNENSSAA